MSAVDPRAEAHRLKSEFGYGARRIATELGISRYAAEQLLNRPPLQPLAAAVRPVAEVADHGRPVAEQPVAGVADAGRQVAEVAGQPVQPRPLPRRMAGPLDGIDVSRSAALRRDLAVLTQSGLSQEALVHQAIVALAFTYRQYRDRGDIADGQAFLISTMTLTPRQMARPAEQAG